jgi:hypothetical protein
MIEIQTLAQRRPAAPAARQAWPREESLVCARTAGDSEHAVGF